MKFLSVCSGIEAASVAFKPLGWEALAFSEIEAFPRAVLAHHYPRVPIHGDFTELKTQRWIADADMLCGGTPCQAFSVAGLRQSLSDDRGNLTLQFVLLANAIDAYRHDAGREPAWILWENVPGVLSTTDNAFGAFLGGLCGCDAPLDEPEGGWTRAGVVDGPARCAAWRVLDAQHFGLAQRRQRVFVLARGGAGRWAAADALLPIIEGVRWHPAPRRSKGEETAAPTAPSLTASGRGVSRTGESRGHDPVVADVAGTMMENNGGGGWSNSADHAAAGYMVPVAHTLKGEGFDASEDGTGRGVPLVPAKQWPAEIASTLDTTMQKYMGYDNQHVNAGCPLFVPHEAPILLRMREGKDGGGKGPLVSEDQSLTLATGNDQVLAYGDTAGTLRANQGSGFRSNGTPVEGLAFHGMKVRRLTPVECEKLQGFPPGYTAIPWRGKPESPDGSRYKALGNSWAVPVVRWIGERIAQVDVILPHP